MSHEWKDIESNYDIKINNYIIIYICNKCKLMKIESIANTLKKKILNTNYYYGNLYLGSKEPSCDEMIIKDILE